MQKTYLYLMVCVIGAMSLPDFVTQKTRIF